MKKKLSILLALVLVLSSLGLGEVYSQEGEHHHSYIGGYTDGTMRPKKEVSRQEAAKILDQALKLEKLNDRDLDFKDLKKGWSYDSVKKVYDNGIMKGDANGKFRPEDGLKRGEAVAMVVRYQKADVDKISVSNKEYKTHWAAKEIQYALDKGILSGYGDGSVRPDAKIKRAEFIAIINSTLGRNCEPEDIEIGKTFKDVKKGDWFYKDIVEATNDHYKGDSVEQPSKPEDKPGKPDEKPTKPEDKPNKPEEKPTVKPGRPGSKPLPKGFTPEAIKQTNIDQWINSLEFREAKPETFDQVLTYFREQTDVEVLDYNIQQEYNQYHGIYLQMGMGPSIGGNASITMRNSMGDKEKGTTVTRYVENGPEWNITGKPFVSQRMYQKGSFTEDLYHLYYDSITWNELDYYMTPEDTIKSYIKIDFNNGDFIEYRISQDVENKTFPKELFNGLEKQWNHDTRPIRK